jgi:hypothetical protein
LNRATTETLVEDGVHLMAARALRLHHDEALVECAVTCLANLANTKLPHVATALLRCESHLLCLNFLRTTTAQTGIRFHAALCLANLSVSPVTHLPLLDANVAEAMTRAMGAAITEVRFPSTAANPTGNQLVSACA